MKAHCWPSVIGAGSIINHTEGKQTSECSLYLAGESTVKGLHASVPGIHSTTFLSVGCVLMSPSMILFSPGGVLKLRD